MNEIKWIVGDIYPISDIMSMIEGRLEGFIINQSGINFTDKSKYRNHPSNEIWLVFSYRNRKEESRYLIAKPILRNTIYETSDNPRSEISLDAREYGDSVEELITKLQENWVFTSKLCYKAKYQEGYKNE
jgi:hypothetical protein